MSVRLVAEDEDGAADEGHLPQEQTGGGDGDGARKLHQDQPRRPRRDAGGREHHPRPGTLVPQHTVGVHDVHGRSLDQPAQVGPDVVRGVPDEQVAVQSDQPTDLFARLPGQGDDAPLHQIAALRCARKDRCPYGVNDRVPDCSELSHGPGVAAGELPLERSGGAGTGPSSRVAAREQPTTIRGPELDGHHLLCLNTARPQRRLRARPGRGARVRRVGPDRRVLGNASHRVDELVAHGAEAGRDRGARRALHRLVRRPRVDSRHGDQQAADKERQLQLDG